MFDNIVRMSDEEKTNAGVEICLVSCVGAVTTQYSTTHIPAILSAIGRGSETFVSVSTGVVNVLSLSVLATGLYGFTLYVTNADPFDDMMTGLFGLFLFTLFATTLAIWCLMAGVANL